MKIINGFHNIIFNCMCLKKFILKPYGRLLICFKNNFNHFESSNFNYVILIKCYLGLLISVY